MTAHPRTPLWKIARPVALLLAASVASHVFAVEAAGLRLATDPLYAPALKVEMGAEQVVAPPGAGGWPYLFQTAEGNTVVYSHLGWPKNSLIPDVSTTRSFDGRKTWEVWKPSEAQGSGPITEGSMVQLKDGRILVFNTHVYHQANQVYLGKRWVSHDGWKTLSGPEEVRYVVPQGSTEDRFDDRGVKIPPRLNVRRSILQLPNGDLVATAYGRFKGMTLIPVEYQPKMNQSNAYLLRSSDEGKNWVYVSTIAEPPIEQEGAGEPVLVQLKHGKHAGRLICQVRTGRENPIYQSESDDEGKTWTKPHALSWVYSRFGRTRPIVGTDPDLIEMSDGTLVMSYGHKVDFMANGNFLAFSLDQGATWTCETQLSSTMTIAYTGVREVSPGTLFVVYTTTDVTGNENYRIVSEGRKFTTVGRTIRVRKNEPGKGSVPPH